MALPAATNSHDASGTLQGVLDHVRHRSDSGWTVATIVDDDGGEVRTIVGVVPVLDPGCTYAFEGEWSDDPKWGIQFRVHKATSVQPSTIRGMERLLGSGAFPNVGPSRAKKIVDEWGQDALQVVFKTPEKLVVIKGINERRTGVIREEAHRYQERAGLMVDLYRYGLTQWQIGRLIQRYGPRASQVLKENPYQVITEIKGFGFKTVDSIAARVGVPRDDIRRARAAVLHLLEEAAGEGHCYLTEDELLERRDQVGLSAEKLQEGIGALGEGLLTRVDGRLALPSLWIAEDIVAERLKELV